MASDPAGRILIVDDDPYFLRVFSRILTGENFCVQTAESAGQAAQALRDNTYDVVISDLRLPDGDGLTILQELRSLGAGTPVVILTAYGEVDSYLAAMNAGAVEYLNKPIKTEDLLEIIRKCLSARAAK